MDPKNSNFWPFDLDQRRFDALDPWRKGEVEGYMERVIEEWEKEHAARIRSAQILPFTLKPPPSKAGA